MEWLILVPTQLELDLLAIDSLGELLAGKQAEVELCGFGPIAAAAATARFIANRRPRQILLTGIAGSYRTEWKMGSAFWFGRVASYGVGVGTGAKFVSSQEVGFRQALADQENFASRPLEELPLRSIDPQKRLLVTVCSAAADEAERNERLRLIPDAVAEDMEGFAVALAGHQAGVPVSIVRGISNLVGDHDHRNWAVEPAIGAARGLLVDFLTSHFSPTAWSE